MGQVRSRPARLPLIESIAMQPQNHTNAHGPQRSDVSIQARARRLLAGRGPAIGVLVLAVLVRLVFVIQLSGSPCLALHHAAQTDMQYFDSWAHMIAGGDLLSRNLQSECHGWARALADDYLRKYPADSPVPTPSGAMQIDRAAMLWRQWVGRARFTQEPFYAYIGGGLYALGANSYWIYALQFLAGVVSTFLVFALTRRFFDERSAVLAALMASLAGPTIYLEAVLVRTAFLGVAGLALAALVDRAFRRGSRTTWFWSGVALGVAVLLQGHFALFLAGVFVLVFLRRRSVEAGPYRAAAALAAGALVGLLPLVVRNVIVGVPPLILASTGSINFIVANASDANPDATMFRLGHAARILHETGGRFLPTVSATLATYATPVELFASLWRKFLAVGHWYEVPDNTNFYYFKLHAGVLRLLFVNFSVAGALGAVGLVLAGRRRFLDRSPLYLLVAVHLAAMLLFVMRDRFRAPLTLALLPFAGFALSEIARAVRARAAFRALALAAPAIALTVFIARPLPPGRETIRSFDYVAAYAAFYDPKLSELDARGEWGHAAKLLEEAAKLEPGFVRRLGPGRVAAFQESAQTALHFAGVRERYAEALSRVGDAAEAEAQRARASELRAAVPQPAG